MPYLGKIFSGGHRRRNRSTTTPRPSLAPTPQQSNATIQTTNPNQTQAVAMRDSIDPVNVNFSQPVAALARNLTNGSIQDGTGSVKSQQATISNPEQGARVGTVPRPTSWWDYFGMNRNKKGSIDSL